MIETAYSKNPLFALIAQVVQKNLLERIWGFLFSSNSVISLKIRLKIFQSNKENLKKKSLYAKKSLYLYY